MLSWTQAHELAHMEAARARSRLLTEPRSGRTDVVGAIVRADVTLIWRRLPGVFGAYLNEPGSKPGILINSGLPSAARRYTAGHELGHHWARHTTSVDDATTISMTLEDEFDSIPASREPRLWTDQEKVAEAFAAWFLMPRTAVLSSLRILGLDRPSSPADVYRLGLLLGVPYRTLVRHLPNVRLANPVATHRWSIKPPSKIKAELDAAFQRPQSRAGDVWLIGAGFDGLTIEVVPGDRLILPGSDQDGRRGLSWLTPVPPLSADRARTECLEVAAGTSPSPPVVDLFSSDDEWHVRVRRVDVPAGVERRCP